MLGDLLVRPIYLDFFLFDVDSVHVLLLEVKFVIFAVRNLTNFVVNYG